MTPFTGVALTILLYLTIEIAAFQAEMFRKNMRINHTKEAIDWTLQALFLFAVAGICEAIKARDILAATSVISVFFGSFGMRWILFDLSLNLIRGLGEDYVSPEKKASRLDKISRWVSLRLGWNSVVAIKMAVTGMLLQVGDLVKTLILSLC